ncbi:hypothetical protein [Leptospira meyeri]|uniref:hypothetical protein n=1 Tax=Leptospira meyeri TaxID=29508 RepID=UPI001FEFA1B2|nr:hypothetical protein [Leptospira meyeri]
MTKVLLITLGIFLFAIGCSSDWKKNAGDPFTKEFWETRLIDEWIVAYPRSFTIKGTVSGLNSSSVIIRSPSDGSYSTVSANGSF